MSKLESYLGDGVYAVYDGFSIHLDLRGQDTTTHICLEPTVLHELNEFYNKSREQFTRQAEHEKEITEKLSQLKTMMVEIDGRLTKKDDRDLQQTMHNQQNKFTNPHVMENFAWGGSDPYYLSDGGYSRIYSSSETGRIHLGSESIEPVVSNWLHCQELRDAMETLMQDIICAEYEYQGHDEPELVMSKHR